MLIIIFPYLWSYIRNEDPYKAVLYVVLIGGLTLYVVELLGPIGGRMGVLTMSLDVLIDNQYLRIDEFKTALSMISENILIGTSQEHYMANKHMFGEGALNHPHSILLEVMLYGGIVGILLIFVYYFMFIHLVIIGFYSNAMLLFFIVPIIGPGNFANSGFFMLVLLALSGAINLYIKSILSIKNKTQRRVCELS